MAGHIKNNVYSVGKIDWELRHFHGFELSTHHGSTYNSYLIKEEKTVLIDSVWEPFTAEFLQELPQRTAIKDIDYVIVNHAEIDHSGALAELMALIPDVPIYCTPNGIKSLKGHFHKEWNFRPVRTGDRLDIGNGKELVFIEAQMIHWPDSMFTFLTGDNILFSNDAFGQHLATDKIWSDLVDQSVLWDEAIKYYANIVAPWSNFVDAKLREIRKMNLPIEMICTSHGVSWRQDIDKILSAYESWAKAYQENRVTIIYDTIWGGTRKLAEAIAKGIAEGDPMVKVAVHNLAQSDKNDVATEIFRSKAFLIGSPTHNKGILTSVAAIMEELRGLAFKGKKAACFGSYGWAAEGQKRLMTMIKECGFELVDAGLTNQWEPDAAALERCRIYGREFAKKI